MNRKTIPCTPFSTFLSRSARETKRRLENIMSGPKKRPPLPVLLLMFSLCIFCGNIVSCRVAEPESSDLEVREYSETLDHSLDLDGDGLEDTVTADVRIAPQDENGSTITLTAALGRGENLVYQWTEEDWLDIDTFSAGHLTSPDRDVLVLELEIFGSTYGAAKTYVLELIDGKLTECYRTNEDEGTVSGAYLTVQEDSSLCELRIPVLVDKWHAPEYYTLRWNGTGWDKTEDGYFTDAETVTVTGGRVLTLALRGRKASGPNLIYDQIQVFDGDMMFHEDKLLQTILPAGVPADGRFPEPVFLADGESYVWIQDINFDGAEDFAVLCDSTRNQGCRWFRWNEGQDQFEYAFSLAGEVELVPEGQKLIETCWTEDWENRLYNVYSFNNRGWLILESTWDSMAEAQNACMEDVQS